MDFPNPRAQPVTTPSSSHDVRAPAGRRDGDDGRWRQRIRTVRAGRPRGPSRTGSRLALAATVAALVPVVVAAARGISHEWVPAGDSALIAVRSRDVLSAHPPLLGLWASTSFNLPFDINHPGPLLFDLLAAPARLFDRGAGLVLGVAALNAASLVGIAVVAWRRGGPLLTTAGVAVAALLSWSMGSEILYEPWHAHSILLPFLLFLFLVWALTCGDLAALPWTAVVGSLVLQTNASYGLLVPALAGWGLAGLILEMRRSRRDNAAEWPRLSRRLRRTGLLTFVLVGLCWAQPLVEELTGKGEGNLTRLVRSLSESTETLGRVDGSRLFSNVVALPPWWFRPSMRDAFPFSPFGTPLPSKELAAASLAALFAVLLLCAWNARSRSDPVAFRAVATAGFLVVVGLATAAHAPRFRFGTAAYQTRWLWPLAAFVWFAVIVTLVRRFAASPSWSFAVAGTLTLVTVVVAAANLPTSNQGTNVPSRSVAVARRLVAQLQPVRDDGPVQFQTFGTVFDPYGPAVVAELRRLGVPFVVGRKDQIGVRQFGRDRRFRGEDDLDAVVIVVTGDLVRETPLSSRRVALVEGLTTKEQRELEALKRRIGAHIRSDGLLLNERGQRVFRRGDLPSLPPGFPEDSVDPAALFRPRRYLLGYHGRDLEVMVREDLLVLDEAWARRFERYADLQERWDNETAAVFLRQLPLPPPAPEPAPVDGQGV
ncbi:MAG: hypothetical protein ACR2IR_12570 [Acidimicrobiia bacterium]